MLTNKELLGRLRVLGLSSDGAKFYLELLKGPSTHLQLSRTTGIERAKIYRIAEQLEIRGLLTRMTDDRGTFLVAADPSHLEIELISQEANLKQQRKALQALLPALNGTQPPTDDFHFKTYVGDAGIKQMCWNELKTDGEIITMGHGNIEALTGDSYWAAKHRDRQVKSGYRNRDLVNENNTSSASLAHEQLYEANLYKAGVVSMNILDFGMTSQTVIYNDVVEIFHFQEEQKVGIEIINRSYANMMRQLFELYWVHSDKLNVSKI